MTRRRRARLALVVLLLVAIGLLVSAGLRDTLSYYRTPGEVLSAPAASRERIRLGGQVVPGSVRRDGGRTLFRLAEAGQEIPVAQRGVPPEAVREGRETVVEGVLGPDGVFQADRLVVRHGNAYRGPADTRPPGDPR